MDPDLRRPVKAHRLALSISGVDVSDDMDVCHRCDNPPCCNPSHLFLGTALDNIRDMRAKSRGRYPGSPGEAHGNSKLTESDVHRIRRLFHSGKTQTEIAKLFRVQQTTISGIVLRKTWTHVKTDIRGHAKRPKWKDAKLDDSDIVKIRSRSARGEPYDSIALAFGVSRTYVSLIVRRLRRV